MVLIFPLASNTAYSFYIALWCCVSFCCTAEGISGTFTHSPWLWNLPPPPSQPPGPAACAVRRLPRSVSDAWLCTQVRAIGSTRPALPVPLLCLQARSLSAGPCFCSAVTDHRLQVHPAPGQRLCHSLRCLNGFPSPFLRAVPPRPSPPWRCGHLLPTPVRAWGRLLRAGGQQKRGQISELALTLALDSLQLPVGTRLQLHPFT